MERSHYFDNAKFILILLVVIGHYCGCYLNSRFLLGFYDTIYSFHMPLFIFISGYFSKNIKQHRFKEIDTILIPYLIIQVFYILYLHFLGTPQAWTFTVPIDADWYLLGLFIWRLIIPYFNYIKYPILVSLIISLSAGYSNEIGSFLDLQRIIAFFPFFVIGYFFPYTFNESLFQVKRKILPLLSIFAIAALLISISFYLPGKASFIKKCFIPSWGYHLWFGKYAEYGVYLRFFAIVSSIAISYIFMLLIPRRKTWYSEFGERTIYVFLFHLVFIYLVGRYIPYTPIYTEILAIPVGLTITLFLSQKKVAEFLHHILNLHNIILHLKIPQAFQRFRHSPS